ncbi:hypothetical protein Q5752_005040 [Cryptotrichosporon argae]
MSASSWPPHVKAWVQECLAKATPSNKAAVTAELKQILFAAHRDGQLDSTNWDMVELQSLKQQAARVTYNPPPPPPPVYAPPAPPVTPTYAVNTPSSPSTSFTPEPSSKKQKKRKKDNFPTSYQFVSAEEEEAKARRAARFQAPPSNGGQAAPAAAPWFEDNSTASGGGSLGARLGLGGGSVIVPGQAGRKKLKGKGGLGYSGEDVMEVDPNVMDWDKHTIRGTSTKLEKSYLRLTSEPSPADIRPLPILKQTLQLLKEKWKANRNYAYAVDQFKSLRQDLTVQRIKNDFTVEVYEIHARIALEAKDLGEYNQCQSMLRQLYELGLKGHPEEFLSYRIIYLLHTRNRSDMAALLAQLTPKEKADPGVHHALQVQAALATSNYTRFFRLFLIAPNMSGYILDHFVERERSAALAVMSKAYLSLPLPYLTQTLAFDDDAHTHTFLHDHACDVYTNHPPAPPPRDPKQPWLHMAARETPLHARVWDCRKAHPVAARAVEKYRVVDLKGQVD